MTAANETQIGIALLCCVGSGPLLGALIVGVWVGRLQERVRRDGAESIIPAWIKRILEDK